MGLVLKTAPIAEPVTLAELRQQLRLVSTNDDTLVTSLGIAARQYVETVTRRALMTQTWTLYLDRFPTYWQDWNNWTGRRTWARSARRLSTDAYRDVTIRLEQPPVQSISSVKYYDTASVLQTLDPVQYITDVANEPARLVPAPGFYWPTAQYQVNAVQIEFVAGFASAALVPETLKAAIKLLVGHWYENRVAVTEGTTAEMPLAVRSLLESEGWGSYVS